MEKNLIIDIKILKYNSSLNHPEKEYDMELKKSSIPYGIKIKPLYNKISKEMRFISFTETPNESKYYKTNYQIFIKRTYAKELDTINKANEISVLIERYKNIETKLIDTKCDGNNTIIYDFKS
ncbi:hypothetical protein H8356DRAFT_1355194 [Neocallimastix lanati (nom. inval.)]|nr:hypothetical protein H8356DRAFT_1355194 [Neocallimastix sp. JGI-2020a]